MKSKVQFDICIQKDFICIKNIKQNKLILRMIHKKLIKINILYIKTRLNFFLEFFIDTYYFINVESSSTKDRTEYKS